MLGLFPAPSLYGFVYKACGGGDSREGLLAIQLFGLASILILLPSITCKRFRDNKEIAERIEKTNSNSSSLKDDERRSSKVSKSKDQPSKKSQSTTALI